MMEYLTMAQATGDAPMPGLSFVPGVDYDPYDEDDRATVALAMEIDMADRNRALSEENARLRAMLNLEDADDDHADWND